MTKRPQTYPFSALFRDFLRVFPEKKILYRRSRKQELREFGGYFSLKRAPALRSEILSGEFGREGRLLQSPLTQGFLQAAIKKVRTQGLARTDGSIGMVDETRTRDPLGLNDSSLSVSACFWL